MSKFKSLALGTLLLAVPRLAFAQPAPPAPEPPAAPPPSGEAPPPPAAAPAAPATPKVDEPPAPPPAAATPEAPPPKEEPATKIGGFVEGAYHRNLGEPSNDVPMIGRVYDTGNSFLLHSAHLNISHALNDNVSGFLSFDAGTDAAITSGLAGTLAQSIFDVQEAYAKLQESGFSLTAGKFVTYQGIEVINGPSNPTITRGYLFGFAEAFTHVGARAHYTTELFDFGVGVVNGWDRYNDNNDSKTVIFKAGVTPAKQFFANLSGSWGNEQTGNNEAKNARTSIDLTGAVIPVEELTLNFQVNYGREGGLVAQPDGSTKAANWYGFGIQPVFKKDAFSLGGRVEYMRDTNNVRFAAGDPAIVDATTGALAPFEKVALWNFTVTPGYTFFEGFTLRAEYRADTADQAGFQRRNADGAIIGKKFQHSMALSAHYVF